MTERQKQVVKLLRQGKSRVEVAKIMGITIDGVRNHLRRITGHTTTKSALDSERMEAKWKICISGKWS